MPICTRPRPGYLLTTSRPCSLLVEKKKKKKVRTTTGLHVNRQRTHRNRFVSLSVASTSSEAENAEKNKSPGGVKMVGGNRPTSPKAWQIMYEALTASEVAPVTVSESKRRNTHTHTHTRKRERERERVSICQLFFILLHLLTDTLPFFIGFRYRSAEE